MKKLIFLVFAITATLSSNAFARQNQLSKRSADAESIRESGCFGRHSNCDPPSSALNQTEPPAEPSTTSESVVISLDQVASASGEAIVDNPPVPQRAGVEEPRTLSREASNQHDNSNNVAATAIGVDTNQWRMNTKGLTLTQPSPWQFPVNRWATHLGSVFGKLKSYSPQTAVIKTAEPLPKTTPQLSTFKLAEKHKHGSPRPTSELLRQERVEPNQIETESSLSRVASQQQVDGTSEYFLSRRSRLGLGTQSTPTTLAAGSTETTIAGPQTQDSILAPTIATDPAIKSTPVAKNSTVAESAIAATPIMEPKIATRRTQDLQAAATRTFDNTPVTQNSTLASSAIAATPITEPKIATSRTQDLPAAAVSSATGTAPLNKAKVATSTRNRISGAPTTRHHSKAAAGVWWRFLPVLFLPLILGYMFWCFFHRSRNGEQKQAMATEDVKQPHAANSVSESRATNQKADTEPTTQSSSMSESANLDLATASGKTIVESAHQVALGSTVASEKEVSTNESTARSFKSNSSSTNQLAIKSASGIASPRPTQLNWNMRPSVASATPSTNDSVSQKDVEPAKRSQDLTNLSAAPDTIIEPEQRSSSPSDVDSAHPDNITSTTAAIAASSAHVASAAALTQIGSGTTGEEVNASQSEESESVQSEFESETEKSHRDDLTRIEGVNEETQQAFYDAGYCHYNDIENASYYDLKNVFKGRELKFSRTDFETWSVQASLCRHYQCDRPTNEGTAPRAASGDRRNQSGSDVPKHAQASSKPANDELTKIQGIGPAIAKLLRKSGIRSFRSLHEASPAQLQTILTDGGSKFKLVDSSLWTEQSRFAMDGDWIGLSQWAANHSVATGESLAQNELDVQKESKSPDTVNASTVGSTAKDDLTKIHGLGKASQKVLNKNEIYSFAQVASMTSQQLDLLFSKSPKRFQLIKTSTWPAQAKQFATAESNEEVSSQILEVEILDEIDSIREIATSGKTSSSAPRKKKQGSKRD